VIGRVVRRWFRARFWTLAGRLVAGERWVSQKRSLLHARLASTSWPLSCDRVGVYMTDPKLFDEVVSLGEELLWLHTFAERFRSPTRTDRIPTVDGLRWQHPVSSMPTALTEVGYFRDTHDLSETAPS
jgi:hypothetical protein